MKKLDNIRKEYADGIDTIRQERKELLEKIREKSVVFFRSTTPELFQKYPKLKAFSWSQYTPYFNDGEECVFNVNSDYLLVQWGEEKKLSGHVFSEYEYVKAGNKIKSTWGNYLEDEFKKIKKIHTKDELEKNQAVVNIIEFLKIFSDEDYEMMFGDHVSVKVTPEGVFIEEYQHD